MLRRSTLCLLLVLFISAPLAAKPPHFPATAKAVIFDQATT